MKLPVHCCCHPETRLGWLEVEHPRIGPIAVLVYRGGWTFGDPPDRFSATIIRTEIAQLEGFYSVPAPAVKSAHEPIDVWRTVPGFTEDTGDAR